MKNYLLFLFFCLGISVSAQTKLQFEYDAAGNQITRKLCINCQSTQLKQTHKEIAELLPEDLQKFSSSDIISYYPNPVLEILYLKWELINDNQVNKIELYSSTGQFIAVVNNTNKTDSAEIPFQNYPTGNYLIVLQFANGDQKSIKIIKQ
jgi:hypothetical protein